jgi:lysophospholipase L1-like esterase
MNKLYLVILIFLAACGDHSVRPLSNNMLVIGDSISLGYTSYLSIGNYQIEHAKANDGDDENSLNTAYGLNRLEDWLNQQPSWGLITFNFGIHDVKIVDGNHNETLVKYEAQLSQIANTLLQHSSRVVFITTVMIPANAYAGYSTPEEHTKYREAALRVMDRFNIPVIDLYPKSVEVDDLHINAEEQNDVHFTEEGYEALGSYLSEQLELLFPSI